MMNEVIKSLRQELKEKGLTRYEVAKRAGLRESTLQGMDADTWNPTLSTLCKIAEAVGLEITVRKRK